MNMKKVMICFVFLMYGLSGIAQENDNAPTFEITAATFLNNPLLFTNTNVNALDFEKGVFSDNNFGWSLGVRRTQSVLTERLDWFVGARGGIHAYSIDLYTTEAFVDLDRNQEFTVEDDNYELIFAEAFTGLRYTFPAGERMKFGFEAAAVINYHFGRETNLNYSAGLDNGQTKELFDADVNIGNKVLVAPQIGVSYQYLFENSGLRFGANLMFASSDILEGSYEFYGDTETLTGTFTQDYNFGGLEIGYFWNLNN